MLCFVVVLLFFFLNLIVFIGCSKNIQCCLWKCFQGDKLFTQKVMRGWEIVVHTAFCESRPILRHIAICRGSTCETRNIQQFYSSMCCLNGFTCVKNSKMLNINSVYSRTKSAEVKCVACWMLSPPRLCSV